MPDLTDPALLALFQRVALVVERARGQVARTVNATMVHAYGLIGREFVEDEQEGRDLKLGKLAHLDLGQMQMYVSYFDRYQRAEHEERTIGIVLCSDKNDAMVRITLPEDNEQILAARCQLYLPTEEEMQVELEREREEAERVVRLAGEAEGEDDAKG